MFEIKELVDFESLNSYSFEESFELSLQILRVNVLREFKFKSFLFSEESQVQDHLD